MICGISATHQHTTLITPRATDNSWLELHRHKPKYRLAHWKQCWWTGHTTDSSLSCPIADMENDLNLYLQSHAHNNQCPTCITHIYGEFTRKQELRNIRGMWRCASRGRIQIEKGNKYKIKECVDSIREFAVAIFINRQYMYILNMRWRSRGCRLRKLTGNRSRRGWWSVYIIYRF